MTDPAAKKGPLNGVRVLEIAGIGPVPFAAMLLADMGAEIVKIDRPVPVVGQELINRGRTSVTLDLKTEGDRAIAADLIAGADILLEGFRPGVMERLGLGPDAMLARNPRLVYGRMTGWGQDGPLASAAGHDVNYIAVTGALMAIGPREGPPAVPLNLVGDYGGGALYLALGVVSAAMAARTTGQGQVVDAAICEGALSLMSVFYQLHQQGQWTLRREANALDGGAPFYGVFECSDGQFVSLGPMEPQFWAEFQARLNLGPEFDARYNPAAWPDLMAQLRELFRTRTRDEWSSLFEGSDVCFGPVLTMAEAPSYPQFQARGSFVPFGDMTVPGAAPRFSGSDNAISAPEQVGDVAQILSRWTRREGEGGA